jgi:Cof subfamily protein (haloacid dehalogenase superfamily)
MYKLFCTDMDGTLLNSQGIVSEENKEAIKLAHENGIKVVICTGRLFASAHYYADLIGIKAPLICSNGAYIREKDRDEVIYKSILGLKNCEIIVQVLRKYDLYPNFGTHDTVYSEKMIFAAASYAKINESLPKGRKIKIELIKDWQSVFEKNSDNILKCIVQHKDLNKIAEAKAELAKYEELEVVSSWSDNFEVMTKGVTKGRAVEILAGYYGIKKEEVICIGDNENDISMIKYAGLGIAMGNGSQVVKEMANYVTDTNDNSGVAKAIEKYIL